MGDPVNRYRDNRRIIESSAAGAPIYNIRHVVAHLYIAMPKLCYHVVPIAVAANTCVEGIAVLGASGCDHRGDIIVNQERLIGLGDNGFRRPAAVQIIGVSSGSSPLIQQEKALLYQRGY